MPVIHSCKARTSLGEIVGGTTAICCCCPCGLVHILILAIYKVPAGLCRRALKNKRRRRRIIEEGLFPPPRAGCPYSCCDDNGIQIQPFSRVYNEPPHIKSRSLAEIDKEVMEMWDRFYSTGFWRSPSQRHSSSHTLPSTVSQR